MSSPLTPRDVALLKAKTFAHLATLMPDGSPQVSPVWIDVDQGAGLILVNTAEGRTKPENVRRDPRVAISLTDPEDPYHAVMIRGRVVEDTHDGAAEHIDELSRRYTGHDYWSHDPARPRVILKIRPEGIVRTHSRRSGRD